jgi:hypothetical protein
MRFHLPRLASVVLIAVLIGWAIFAPVLAYVAGHTEGYVFGLRDVQKVIHEETPPAIPIFPPPPTRLKVNHRMGDPNGLGSGPYPARAEGGPLHL